MSWKLILSIGLRRATLRDGDLAVTLLLLFTEDGLIEAVRRKGAHGPRPNLQNSKS